MLKKRRRSKRTDVRESFECQCGKKYLSFSALYLHACKKHGRKLSSKPSSLECDIEVQEGFKKYKYSTEKIQ